MAINWQSVEVSDLFAPSIVTPAQFFGDRRDEDLLPIKRLMLAVLEDAIRCLQFPATAGGGVGRRLRAEAAQWMASDTRASVFSFAVICDTLEVEPQHMRAVMRAIVRGGATARDERFDAILAPSQAGRSALRPALVR